MDVGQEVPDHGNERCRTGNEYARDGHEMHSKEVKIDI
jgi:hypothetical protein